jgi:hypothetical protein
MKKIAAIFVLFGVFLFGANAIAQPICDFATSQTTPTFTYYDNNNNAYSTWSAGSQNWDIVQSTIKNPNAPYPNVLHTNGRQGKSPQWLTSQLLINIFPWQYNSMQWSWWFGRRANNGQNGGNQDRSYVWLYVNSATNLDAYGTPGFEGIAVYWHHDSNVDAIRLSEIYGGVEHPLGNFTLLDNLSDYQWGTTVRVLRIPGGVPTGSTVRYQVYLSTPPVNTPGFDTTSVSAFADPNGASVYLRIDTTLTSPHQWGSTTGRVGFMSYYAGNARNDAAEYSHLCVANFGPVPVELTSFNAIYRDGQVNLKWHTATETNNNGFEIQRSVEHDGNWETIGFIDGHGTSNKPNDYTYTDVPNFDGVSMIAYRLKQIDRDGSYKYSSTILVSIAPKSTDVLYNYPNPFNPTTNISFNLLQADVVTLNIYNTAGDKVAVLYNHEPMSPGFHTASFDGAHMPSGRYFYSLTTSTGTKTNSMVLSK